VITAVRFPPDLLPSRSGSTSLVPPPIGYYLVLANLNDSELSQASSSRVSARESHCKDCDQGRSANWQLDEDETLRPK